MAPARRWAVPGVPFALSLVLSLVTLGSTLGWQDSGFFLTAVREGALLYPPGFVLWLGLCKAWTLLLFFVPFTVAVHLFSAACAALAAAFTALAARALLAATGPFKAGEPGPADDVAAAAAGCLAAAGYTFWASGILAKVYALYFLAVAALLWRMIVAAESGQPRDLTIVAALIGLAWAAHPSATNLGLALALFVAVHGRALGARGLAWRVGLAALCAAGPSLLGIPLLGARASLASFGQPRSAGELAAWLAGLRFVGESGAFVLEPSRLLSVGRYFAEEFLVVGGLASLAGAVLLARANRRLAVGLAAWCVPALVVTVLFAVEGQHDFWFVAAWIPLHVAGALALRRLTPKAAAAAAAAGVLCAVALNVRDLRGDALPEEYARAHLAPLDRDALLVAGSDDAVGGVQYLQSVRGERPDVLLVRWSRLGERWYDEALARRRSDVVVPDYASAPGATAKLAVFANANLRPGRPIYFERPPDPAALRPDAALTPAGALWRLTPKSEARLRESDWSFPWTPEEILARERRARGQRVSWPGESGPKVRPEPYERRVVNLLLRARGYRAEALLEEKTPEALRRALELLESVLKLDPGGVQTPALLFRYGTAQYGLGRLGPAETAFRELERLDVRPRERALALYYRSRMAAQRGEPQEAARLLRDALAVPGLDPKLREELTPK